MRAQAELDVREGRKHNVQLGFASQRLSDMGEGIIAQSTGRFMLGADDQREREEIIKRFGLHRREQQDRAAPPDRSAPGRRAVPGGLRAEQAHYEQFLINSFGPIELWALSTTPSDTSLRNRLYERVGFTEGTAPAIQRVSERLGDGRDRTSHQGADTQGRRCRAGRGRRGGRIGAGADRGSRRGPGASPLRRGRE